jgi:ABC-type amino acid transport substrate-binding protein
VQPTLSRSRVSLLSTVGAFLALALVGLTVFLGVQNNGDRPTVSEYLALSSLKGRADIRIGVLDGVPLVSTKDQSGKWSGFDIAIAQYLARSLGFSAAHTLFVPLTVEDRINALQAGTVDLVVADLTITAERAKYIRFAGPYLVASVEALVLSTEADRLGSLADLRGAHVCVSAGASERAELERLGAVLNLAANNASCVAGLKDGKYDVVVASNTALAGYQATSGGAYVIKDLPIAGVEHLGIGVPSDDEHLQALVQHFLHASYRAGSDGAWQKAFDQTLRGAMPPATQPAVERTVNLRDDVTSAALSAAQRSRQYRQRQPSTRRRRLPRPRGSVDQQPRPRRARPVRPPVTAGAPESTEGRRDWQGPWSLVVAVPAAMSALHLWMQSGGNLQLTLLLVDSVNPISFFATMMLAALWQITAAPILIFAFGSVILYSAIDAEDREQLARDFFFAAWAARLPRWVLWLSLTLAALSWPVMYLPWLALAAYVTIVVPRQTGLARWTALIALGSLAVLSPALTASVREDELYPLVALLSPVLLLMLGVGRPIHRSMAHAFGRAATVLAAALTVGAVFDIVTVPILPQTVLEVSRTDSAGNRLIGGHIMSHDDDSTSILLDQGRIETIKNETIQSQTTCLQDGQRFHNLDIHGVGLDQSLLDWLARNRRPTASQDPRCGILAN